MESLIPWDARDTMSLRTGFVLFASQDGVNIRSLYRHFGISPATGYKWLRRWAAAQPPPEQPEIGLIDHFNNSDS